MGVAAVVESVPAEALKARGRPDLLPWLHGTWAVSCLVLIALLVGYGSVGVGLAWSFSTSLVALAGLALVRRVVDVSAADLVRVIAPPMGSATAVVVGLLLIQRSTHWEPAADLETVGLLLGQMLPAALAYAGLIALVDRRAVRELRSALALVRRRRQAA
jgi:hypothetical protein